MKSKLRLLATVVLIILLMVLSGLKTAQCCHVTQGKMVCHCAERGLVCLCPIVSCPHCENHNDLQVEDWSKDVIFHFSKIIIIPQSLIIGTERFTAPGPVYLPALEKPPRIL